MSKQKKICVGQVGAPHGVKGDVRLMSFMQEPDDIVAYGRLMDETGKAYTLVLKGHHKDKLIVAIEGVDSREAAQHLTNMKLYLDRAALPALEDDGTFYQEDLVGLTVRDLDGKDIGDVIAVHNFGAGDLLEVRFTNGEQEYISFTQDTVPEVDLETGFLIYQPPEMVETKEKAGHDLDS